MPVVRTVHSVVTSWSSISAAFKQREWPFNVQVQAASYLSFRKHRDPDEITSTPDLIRGSSKRLHATLNCFMLSIQLILKY